MDSSYSRLHSSLLASSSSSSDKKKRYSVLLPRSALGISIQRPTTSLVYIRDISTINGFLSSTLRRPHSTSPMWLPASGPQKQLRSPLGRWLALLGSRIICFLHCCSLLKFILTVGIPLTARYDAENEKCFFRLGTTAEDPMIRMLFLHLLFIANQELKIAG